MIVIEQIDGFRVGDDERHYLRKVDGWDRSKVEVFARVAADEYERGYEDGLEDGESSALDDEE